MLRRLAASACVALFLGGAAPALASAADYVEFQNPGGDVSCLYGRFDGHPTLRCDLRKAPPVTRPASCNGDYGLAFGLSPTGRGTRLCAGDTVRDPQAPVLAAGRTRKVGPYTCRASAAAMRCTNRRGHGFALSAGHVRLF